MNQPNRLNEKLFLFLTLFACFVFFSILVLTSETTFDVGDGIRHYLISRYSWYHPYLFLDSWGKPFFTLVSSPFSQFGILGASFFNIICGVLSAYIVYKIAKKLNYKNALLSVPFLFFAPVYFPTMNSGLTEPFFGLVLIVSIYLILEKRFAAAAILVSLLPFVRTEGFLFLPLFFIFFIYNRSVISAFLLSFGTLVYSVIGFFYFGDFLWIKTQNPYTGSNRDAYGRGELLSFVHSYDFIWGSILSFLLVAGILYIVFKVFFGAAEPNKNKLSSFINVETTLILGCFVIFFVAHSYMWWKGLANSMGLIRVFAGLMPCSTLICLRGFNLITPDFLFRNKYIKFSIVSILLFFVLLKPFTNKYYPFKLSGEQLVVKKAAEWMKAENNQDAYIYYLYPYLPLLLDIDAFDNNKVSDLWALFPSIKKHGIDNIPNGAIVFWDAHFGPNECGIPLDTLMNHRYFDLLKTFYPEERFTTLGGYAFSVSVFQKRPFPKPLAENSIKELSIVPFDLGNRPELFDQGAEYGKQLKNTIQSLPSKTSKIVFSAKYLSEEVASKDALVVMTIDNKDGKNIFWDGKPFNFSTDSTSTKIASASFSIVPNAFEPTDIVTIFVWNKDRNNFSISENKISYWGQKE